MPVVTRKLANTARTYLKPQKELRVRREARNALLKSFRRKNEKSLLENASHGFPGVPEASKLRHRAIMLETRNVTMSRCHDDSELEIAISLLPQDGRNLKNS